VEAGAWAKSLPKGAAARVAWEQSAPIGMKARAFVQGLGDKALEAGAKYDAVTGRDLSAILQKEAAAGPLGASFRPSAKVEQYFKDKGFGGAIEALKYSPQDWAQKVKLVEYQDALDRAAGKLIDIKTPEDLAHANEILDRMGGVQMTKEVPDSIATAAHALDATPDEAKSLVSQMSNMAEPGAAILQDVPYLRPETAARMEDYIAKSGIDKEGIKYLKKSMEELRATGKNATGWKAYDDAIAKLENAFNITYKDKKIPVAKKVLDFMDLTHRIFALMKVPLSPSAWSNALGGNLVMAHLSGINVLDPKFYQSINGAWDVAKGKVNPKFFEQKYDALGP
jgi:hypothetical protein